MRRSQLGLVTKRIGAGFSLMLASVVDVSLGLGSTVFNGLINETVALAQTAGSYQS